MKMRQRLGDVAALVFLASFSTCVEAFHVSFFTLTPPSVPCERGFAVTKVSASEARKHAFRTNTQCVRCSSGVKGRQNPSTKHARRVDRLLGLPDGEGGQSREIDIETGACLDDKTLEDLWTRPRKHLMSVGRAGVKPSHVRSLHELVEAHTLVKVKVNMPNPDYAEIGLQLCGRLSVDGSEGRGVDAEDPDQDSKEAFYSAISSTRVSVVTSRAKQNMILFAKTEFLGAVADGRDSSSKSV